jgi:nucleoside-diphosphate-sugar epimerase
MATARETIVITGISGNLGQRLLPMLSDFDVVGVDMHPPALGTSLKTFVSADLGTEASCHQLVDLLRETRATQVLHLAFVIDPQRTGVLDERRMWQINVAGTARVMEAVTEVHRRRGSVRKFIFPSSVSAYGPETNGPVTEDAPLAAHTLPYAIHKQEADEVVRFRAPMLGDCATYILRPHIFAGATMQNYLVGALRGTPTGSGRLGQLWRDENRRLPLMLPFGEQYLRKEFQFVHVDDIARLLSFILHQEEKRAALTILNVAGRGGPVTLQRCAELAGSKITRVPKFMCRRVLQYLWNRGISGIPPEALPYMIGSYTMNTARLRAFLGAEYESVIHFTNEEALVDSFRSPVPDKEKPAAMQQPV